VLFTIRSERQLLDRLDRLMLHEIDALFFGAIKKQAYARKLLVREPAP